MRIAYIPVARSLSGGAMVGVPDLRDVARRGRVREDNRVRDVAAASPRPC